VVSGVLGVVVSKVLEFLEPYVLRKDWEGDGGGRGVFDDPDPEKRTEMKENAFMN